MVPPPDETAQSLGDGVTGSDVGPPEESSAQSLGDQATAGDVGSSASDLDALVGDLEDDQGEVIDLEARYEIQKTLGIGGMGEVVLARDKRLNRQVAIKRLKEELGGSRRAAQRFLTEAQSVAALNHFNIVQIHDYGQAADGPFIVMEYVGGRSLAETLEGGALELERVIELGCQLCEAIGVAHQAGIIHRDIKPANVLMTAEGMPKLTDFGLARQETVDGGQTQAGAVLGTLDFMPPEQKVDATKTDARSDLWSLGATLYQMATGKSPRVIRLNDLPGSLQDVLSKALEEDPEERFQAAGEFRDALRSAGTASKGPSVLSEGECPGCGQSNPLDLKFCRHCGETLETGCLGCREPMGVWSTFCGACGTSVEDALSAVREQLDARKQEIETLGQGARYAKAIESCAVLGETDHPQLKEYVEWSTGMVAQLQEEQSRRETERGELLAAAKASYADHADRDVLQLLERVPEPLRDEEVRGLLQQATVRTKRSQELKEELNRAIASKDYDGLVPQVEEYLGLRPGDDAAVQLLDQLQAREARKTRRRQDDSLLSSWRPRVEELVGELRHQEALAVLTQLVKSGQADSEELRSWVETTREKVGREYEPLRARWGEMAQAAEVAYEEGDYARVVELLGAVPSHERSSGSEKSLRMVMARKKQLHSEMKQARQNGQLHIHAEILDQYLQLFPNDENMQAAHDRFEDKEASRVKAERRLTQELARAKTKASSLRWLAAAVAVVLLLSFLGLSWKEAAEAERLAAEKATAKKAAAQRAAEEFASEKAAAERLAAEKATAKKAAAQQVAEEFASEKAAAERLAAKQKAERRVTKRVQTLKGHSGSVRSVSFSPDGKRIVSGSWDKTLKVWDAQTGLETLTLKGHTNDVNSVSFSPDGKRIVSGSYDKTLKIWDAETGQETLTLKGHSSSVTSVSFSPDGKRIVNGSNDNTVKVWDAETGQETLTLRGHSGPVRSVSFSPDGKRIVSGSSDRTVKVWDAQTGRERLTLKAHSSFVLSVSFSPDGKRIVSGHHGMVKVWDAQTGQETLTLKGHSSYVSSVSFSPDGKRIVSGSGEFQKPGEIKVWDAQTGQKMLTLEGHTGPVLSVSFSPDGKRIVSGSYDKTLKVWDISSLDTSK